VNESSLHETAILATESPFPTRNKVSRVVRNAAGSSFRWHYMTAVALTKAVSRTREHEIATGASYCAVAHNGMQTRKLLPPLCAESIVTCLVGLRQSVVSISPRPRRFPVLTAISADSSRPGHAAAANWAPS
jgi:hypothetical protein